MDILVVDDDKAFNELVRKYLGKLGYTLAAAYSATEALNLIEKQQFGLVLVDYKLPGMNGLELTKIIKQNYPEIPIILITNYSDIRLAVNSIKIGAFEFVSKPIVPDELLKVVRLALSNDVKSNDKVAAGLMDNGYVVGKNKQASALWEHLMTVAPTKMNVLIYGESGTGKEHIARTLHKMSRRADKKFVAIDCGAISTEIATSELFGHVRGAFTGAMADKTGVFEEANGGTLFMDEIGNLPYDIQVQLLRTLQEGTIKKVGSNKEIKIDVRLVAATNENLTQNIETKGFRNDLYHRLNEFELFVPSLRERLEDLDEFCGLFIEQANNELGKDVTGISPDVRQAFLNYHWPGNLRELKNIIRRSVLLASGNKVEMDDLPVGMRETNGANNGIATSNRLLPHNIKHQNQVNERQLIEEALKHYKYNKSKAAEALNIDRSTLYKKIKDYNIDA